MQNNNPVVCCPVYGSETRVQLVNIIDGKSGKTTETYEIKNARHVWKGNDIYKFLFQSNNEIYGYNSADSSDLILSGDDYLRLSSQMSVDYFDNKIFITDFCKPQINQKISSYLNEISSYKYK